MISLNTTAINNILVSVANELHVNLSSLQWVVNSYLLVLAAFVVVGGQLGDLWGRRKIFLVGLVIFIFGSVLAALSQAAWMLVAGRIVLAAGAALIMPATLSIINVVFDAESKKTAFSIWGAIIGLGIAIGPLVGGIIVETLSWQWVFWLNIPFAVLAMFIAFIAMPESHDSQANAAIDVGGVIFLGLGIFGVIFVLDQGPIWGYFSWLTILTFLASLVCIIIFVVIELRVKAPLVHLGHFREKNFAAANVSIFILSWALFALIYQFNVVFQNHLSFGLDAFHTGLALLPMSMCYFVVSLFAGKIMTKLGIHKTIVIGMSALALGAFGLFFMPSDAHYIEFGLPLMVFGLGLGLTMSPTSVVALAAVPPSNVGEASGITNVSRYIGGAIGVAICSLVYSSMSKDRLLALLSKARVNNVELEELEGLIAGVKAQSRASFENIPPDQLPQLLADAKSALYFGFSTSMLTIGVVALIGAILCFFMIRERRPPN